MDLEYVVSDGSINTTVIADSYLSSKIRRSTAIPKLCRESQQRRNLVSAILLGAYKIWNKSTGVAVLAVYILDSYCAGRYDSVYSNAAIVTACAIMLASKWIDDDNEIQAIEVSKLTDESITVVTEWEYKLLIAVDWKLDITTPIVYISNLRRPRKIRSFATYLAQLYLTDWRSVGREPIDITTNCVYLAHCLINKNSASRFEFFRANYGFVAEIQSAVCNANGMSIQNHNKWGRIVAKRLIGL